MRKRFHGLKKPKPRQDWSKWNLYALSQMQTPRAGGKTFFQQKWLAKSLTRSYHGEQIREGQWTRMFDRRLPAVVPVDYRKLAASDGSEQAAGRGSGLDLKKRDGKAKDDARRKPATGTSYMHMTYHPTERRLDTAIWRSLFASSTRQARQFVVHGFVKVNGKKMIYPGYLLNPGDMFSVEPERVLFATGARKSRKDSNESLQGVEQAEEEEQVEEGKETNAADGEESAEADGEGKETESKTEEAAVVDDAATGEEPKKALQSLLARAKTILSESKKELSGRRQVELRAFSQTLKKTISRIRGTKADDSKPMIETIDGLEETLNSITAKIPDATPEAAPSSTTPDTTTTPSDNATGPGKEDAYMARKNAQILHAALQRAQENPIDVRKPYATPWRPREYMSAFAFIPRYLEVNQNICSAVYIRHPVARPGLAEVPTPFHGETMALAFNWYLRRR